MQTQTVKELLGGDMENIIIIIINTLTHVYLCTIYIHNHRIHVVHLDRIVEYFISKYFPQFHYIVQTVSFRGLTLFSCS